MLVEKKNPLSSLNNNLLREKMKEMKVEVSKKDGLIRLHLIIKRSELNRRIKQKQILNIP